MGPFVLLLAPLGRDPGILIEEIAVSTLHDGGQVRAVPDPPGGIAAYLRVPAQPSRRNLAIMASPPATNCSAAHALP